MRARSLSANLDPNPNPNPNPTPTPNQVDAGEELVTDEERNMQAGRQIQLHAMSRKTTLSGWPVHKSTRRAATHSRPAHTNPNPHAGGPGGAVGRGGGGGGRGGNLPQHLTLTPTLP